jgi:hypothetical protein
MCLPAMYTLKGLTPQTHQLWRGGLDVTVDMIGEVCSFSGHSISTTAPHAATSPIKALRYFVLDEWDMLLYMKLRRLGWEIK